MAEAPASLAELRAGGCSYPRFLTAGCQTGLLLFAAGFYGRSDAVWLADAGLACLAVDRDALRLEAMARLYPDSWAWVCADAFAFADSLAASNADAERRYGRRGWDLVSIDPPIGLCRRAFQRLPDWLSLARHAATITIVGDQLREVADWQPPDGWQVQTVAMRSAASAWLGLRRPPA